MKKTISIENQYAAVMASELTASLNGKEAVIVTTSKFRYILLNKSFLDRFSCSDQVQVAGCDLDPCWGQKVRVTLDGPHLLLHSSGYDIAGWRCVAISDDVDMSAIKKELENARAYVRVCEFSVEDI